MAKLTKAEKVRRKLRPMMTGCSTYEDTPTKATFLEAVGERYDIASSQYSTIRRKLWEELSGKTQEKVNEVAQPTTNTYYAAFQSSDIPKLARLSGQVVQLMERNGIEEVTFTRDATSGEATLIYQAAPPPPQRVKLHG